MEDETIFYITGENPPPSYDTCTSLDVNCSSTTASTPLPSPSGTTPTTGNDFEDIDLNNANENNPTSASEETKIWPKNNIKSDDVPQALKTFCNQTTAHGFSHIGRQDQPLIKRILWFVLTLLG
ncbi:hypothetical protein SK128_007305 [Halocaridina rubra]|uniref:Uncharacterized protein n=1 Tax=Halocaridina rubra TaxID=373956 RepID=A0AAN8XEE5_HALRR